MKTSASPTPAQHAALARMQQFMTNSLVPSISTELLSTADNARGQVLLFASPSRADTFGVHYATVSRAVNAK